VPLIDSRESGTGRIDWTDLDVEHARRAQARPQAKALRPIDVKTPSEIAQLERLRAPHGKKDDK
jgi:hypothetical protein